MVGEHSMIERRVTVRTPGRDGRDHAGMSSDNANEKLARRKPKVS